MAEVDLRPTEASKAGRALHNQDLTPARSRCLPFIMDKFVLRQQVLERLAEDLRQAEQAVRAAHEAATHEENIAENKYDTLGLEAAYLATGQARRAEAIRQAMANLAPIPPEPLRREQRYTARRAGLPNRFRRQAATALSWPGWGQHEVGQRRSDRSGHQQRSPFGQGHVG